MPLISSVRISSLTADDFACFVNILWFSKLDFLLFQSFINELFESNYSNYAYEIILQILTLRDNSYWLLKVSEILFVHVMYESMSGRTQ